MRVIFQKHAPGTFSGLIRWWTKSPYSHCELLFEDNTVFSAIAGTGTRFYTLTGHLSRNVWDTLYIETTLEDEMLARVFCASETNCGYDWWGLLASQVLRLQREHPRKWFCSEICTAALQRIGRLKGVKPCTVSPASLYDRLVQMGATVV